MSELVELGGKGGVGGRGNGTEGGFWKRVCLVSVGFIFGGKVRKELDNGVWSGFRV